MAGDFRRRSAVILLSLLATACANSTTSYRTERFGRNGPAVITQDAKTRNLIMVPERVYPGIPGTGTGTQDPRDNQWRVCAEAAPDVFSAISTSAAGRLGLDTRGSGTQGSIEAAMALAEVAGTIERTAFVNMLREAMYRTCERYLSGAIDRASFVVQAGRDWRMMLYGLTIQQLTQSVRPPSAILVPPTTMANLAPADRAKVIAAQERLRTATENYRKAEDLVCPAAGGAGGGGGGQEGGQTEQTEETPTAEEPTAETPTPETPATPATPAVPAGCATRQRDMDRAKEDQDMARAEIAAYGVSSNGSGANGASTGAGTSSGGSGGSVPSDTALAIVAPVLDRIVGEISRTDETQLFCLQALSRNSGFDQYPEILGECTRYLMTSVMTEQQALINRADLRAAGVAEAVRVRATRAVVLRFLAGLTDAQYQSEAAAVRSRIATFCPSLNRLQCIGSVSRGDLDGVDATTLNEVIQARITERARQ